MKTIAEILGVPYPKVYAYKAEPKIPPQDHIPAPNLLYGVELEIENCIGNMQVAGMRVETDGSLRNNGLEFITEPMELQHLIRCLTAFFAKNGLSDNNYSERTAIHVHTNCTDLIPTQVASICVIYQVFEKVLFNFIGNDRASNIFCVPWSETTVSYQTVTRMVECRMERLRDWYKYTALNLAPLLTFGTVEWRHMAGTYDLPRILLWCQLIGSIFAYARKYTNEDVLNLVINLNTTSQYHNVIDAVFGQYAKHLKNPGYEMLIEEGVLNMKYALAKPPKKLNILRQDMYFTAPQAVNWGAAVDMPAPFVYGEDVVQVEEQF